MNTLVVFSEREDDREFGRIAAQRCGLEFSASGSIARKQSNWRQSTPPAVVMAEVASAEQSIALHESFGGRLRRDRVHVFSSPDQLAQFDPLSLPTAGSLVARKPAGLREVATIYGDLLRATLMNEPFGLERLMAAEEDFATFDLVESLQKGLAADAIDRMLLDRGVQRRMAAVVSNAVDELLMNAIFDAQVEPSGQQVHENTDRGVNVKLEGRSAVRLQIATNAGRIGATVTDRYGSLQRDRILAHIARGYSASLMLPKTVGCGAGIGLAEVFRSGASLFFATRCGVRTDASVFFQLPAEMRVFKQSYQFVSTWTGD